MKKILSKYKLMTVVALGGATASNADVIYTDVDPDQSFTENGDEYDLDVNNDGDIDFKITNSSFAYNYPGYIDLYGNFVNISPENNGNGMISGTFVTSYNGNTYTSSQIMPIKANEAVSSSKDFTSSSALLLGNMEGTYFGYDLDYKFGAFNDTIFDRFIGLKFADGGSTYYGWARVSVHVEKGSQDFTIFDYAYEDSGDPIYAGAGIVSPGSLSLNDDLAIEGLKVQNLNGQIHISSVYSLVGKVMLLNISGATIQSKAINGKELILNAENNPAGTYLVQVINEDGKQGTKKIIL